MISRSSKPEVSLCKKQKEKHIINKWNNINESLSSGFINRYESILHFFLHLLADELFGMCSYFICLVAAKQDRDLILNDASIGQNVVKVPGEVQNHVQVLHIQESP